MLALAISGRTRELGLRLALGARPADLARSVMASSLRQTFTGMILGALFAAWMVRALERLYGIDPWQPAIVAIVLATLWMTGLAAAWLPGRRAARTDPAEALRRS